MLAHTESPTALQLGNEVASADAMRPLARCSSPKSVSHQDYTVIPLVPCNFALHRLSQALCETQGSSSPF